jgi:hypothetical protein
MAKAEKVVIEIDGEVFEVPRSALKSVKKAVVPAPDRIMKDIQSHDSKLHADLEAMFSDYQATMKLPVPGIGCKKGSMEFFFGIEVGIEGGEVTPLDFTMSITNLHDDQMPVFMGFWCDEGCLKDVFSVYEIWDQVLRSQGAVTMDKADKMIEKLDEKYKALRDRVRDFIKDHYGIDDDGLVDSVMEYYENSYGGLLE